MDYYDVVYQATNILYCVLAGLFLILLIFGKKESRYHSSVIIVATVIYFLMPEAVQSSSHVTYKLNFIQSCETALLLDSAAALTLTMFLKYDKIAWKQAVLFGFATLCHFMVILQLQSHSFLISNAIYSFYDELIVVIICLQIGASWDGINTALSNALGRIQDNVLWLRFYCYYLYKNLFLFTKRENKT